MNGSSFQRGLVVGLSVVIATALAAPALGEVVNEDEAVAVAELWLRTEIEEMHPELTESETASWLTRLEDPAVFYLLNGDVLLELAPDEGVIAYVVAYRPGAYVVITADDRLEPVLVFDAFAPFRGDRVPENFLRDFLARNVPARWAHLRALLDSGVVVDVHPNWSWLRQQLGAPRQDAPGPLGDPRGGAYVLWETALWDQWWPYNTEVVIHNGNNSCPVGCTATAMAIRMRFHSWPPVGCSAKSYTDNNGELQYSHYVVFAGNTYDWDNMPTDNFNFENFDVAQLMYHCGVAVSMDYEPDGSGAWPSADATNTYFRYRGTIERTSNHTEPMATSILAGLPVVISSSSHTVLACGYRDSPSPPFYLNVGWGGSNNGWYDLSSIPGSDPTIDRSYPYSSPDNFVFVDGNWTGWENGDLQTPYDTVPEGAATVPADGHLWIKAGSYTGPDNVPVTIDTPMTLVGYQGIVTIGGP